MLVLTLAKSIKETARVLGRDFNQSIGLCYRSTEPEGLAIMHGRLCPLPVHRMVYDPAPNRRSVLPGVERDTLSADVPSVDFTELLNRDTSNLRNELDSLEGLYSDGRRGALDFTWKRNVTFWYRCEQSRVFHFAKRSLRILFGGGLLFGSYAMGKIGMSTLDSATIAFFSLLLGVIIALFTAFKYFTNEISTVRKEAELNVKSAADSEGKQRHAVANALQIALNEMRLDLNRTNEKYQALALEVVRKTDMTAFENRITAVLGQQETRFTLAIEKLDSSRAQSISHLETKIDRVIELRRSGTPHNAD